MLGRNPNTVWLAVFIRIPSQGCLDTLLTSSRPGDPVLLPYSCCHGGEANSYPLPVACFLRWPFLRKPEACPTCQGGRVSPEAEPGWGAGYRADGGKDCCKTTGPSGKALWIFPETSPSLLDYPILLSPAHT